MPLPSALLRRQPAWRFTRTLPGHERKHFGFVVLQMCYLRVSCDFGRSSTKNSLSNKRAGMGQARKCWGIGDVSKTKVANSRAILLFWVKNAKKFRPREPRFRTSKLAFVVAKLREKSAYPSVLLRKQPTWRFTRAYARHERKTWF